ncbi:Cytochrome C oxidase, cbb3-type, subunit III [Halopseudomonas xinjiangensis]|uniref:Cytochrome C oxidase, cbb3-type, subunit III n=1 Tax=Halopseudomonas xinjiangensis TaxID=487184 RepID=A0A1H1SY84_9GAMM|nr:cytochrome c [Halopseudomonas xinjiangensis]SDS52369.1 Cytochrome C oxidase, cbb3-type, subunit III [Halopseudomonas xinjiangensis]
MKKIVGTLVVAFAVFATAVAGVVYFGVISVAADEPHSAVVHDFLEVARNRSIAVRSESIDVPDLKGADNIQAGSGNYDAMCASCHLTPGQSASELSKGLYPSPPDLTQTGLSGDPARTFWIIKHGIKASGMPAWGQSMADQYIWEMVAFLDELPSLNAEEYRTLVASSGGHQHGGGETAPHGDHHSGTEAAGGHAENHHGAAEASQPSPAQPSTHIHADGKEHLHEH